MASSSSSTTMSVKELLSLVNVKLTKDNYSLWSLVMSPVMGYLGGSGHLDGSCPPPCESDALYSSWIKLDQLLVIVINSTLSVDVLSILAATTVVTSPYRSKDIWGMLKQICSTPAADDSEPAADDPDMRAIVEASSKDDIPRGSSKDDIPRGMKAIIEYIRLSSAKKSCPIPLRDSVKEFLTSEGWKVYPVKKKDKQEIHYTSPGNKNYSSLVIVCKEIVEKTTVLENAVDQQGKLPEKEQDQEQEQEQDQQPPPKRLKFQARKMVSAQLGGAVHGGGAQSGGGGGAVHEDQDGFHI